MIKVYIVIDLIGGLLLYILDLIGIGFLFFMRDLLIITPILIYILLKLNIKKLRKNEIILVAFLILFLSWGLYNMHNILLILYGLKLLIPFLLGILLSKYLIPEDFELHFLKFYRFIFFICIGGILLNYFISFPWVGSSINIGEYEVETARAWSVFGTDLKRLSGLTRGSSMAATLLAISSVLIISSFKTKTSRFTIISVTIICLALTTMKGVIISYIIVFVCYSINSLRLRLNQYPLYFFSLSIMLPILGFLLIDYLLTSNETLFLILYSFLDRVFRVWPETISLILDHGGFFMGRGLGGVGIPQKYFEPDLYQPADNLFLHLWGNVGLIGLVYFGLFLIRFKTISKDYPIAFLLFILLMFSNGIITAVTVNSEYLIILGFLFGGIMIYK